VVVDVDDFETGVEDVFEGRSGRKEGIQVVESEKGENNGAGRREKQEGL